MSLNPEPGVILVPPRMVEILHALVRDYADATGQPADECRRLVEIAVLTRGVRMMQEQVVVERETAVRMGWV